MTQVATIVVANDTGAAVRAQINGIMEAITTHHAGATAPAETFPHMTWIDTSTTPAVFKVRNAADNAWETLLDGGTF